MDAWKVGRIPDGGGWQTHGRAVGTMGTMATMGTSGVKKRAPIGFDAVHTVVDDHTRLADAAVLPDEHGAPCAALLLRATRSFADHRIRHHQDRTRHGRPRPELLQLARHG